MVSPNFKLNVDQNLEKSIDKFTNFDAEIAVIGCLLWDNRSYEKIADFLNENHFVDETNKIIFSTIKNLLDKNILVSPITLKNDPIILDFTTSILFS